MMKTTRPDPFEKQRHEHVVLGKEKADHVTNLEERVAAIQEYFEKVVSEGDQVSVMLEIDRAQLKKTVYHSSSVLSNLSSSWTLKSPLAVKYKLNTSTRDEGCIPKSLSSTLDRHLAWEKKLFQDDKAREGVKMKHRRKLCALRCQEYEGAGFEARQDQSFCCQTAVADHFHFPGCLNHIFRHSLSP